MSKKIRGKGGSSNPHDNALTEFAKEAFKESINVIKDFIKLMIPLTTGLITAYLALLKFLVGDTISEIENIEQFTVIEPAYFMLGGLVAFIFAIFPVPQKLTVGSIDSMKSYRNSMITWRFSGACIASILFLIGVFKMIGVINLIIF